MQSSGEKAPVGDDKAIYGVEQSTDAPPTASFAQCPELPADDGATGRDEGKSQLIFKFTREKKPLPSPLRARWIV